MLFRSKTFVIDSDKIACLVCGFASNIKSYSNAVEALKAAGYSVVAYEYDQDVFAAGDSQLLPKLISEITEDFALRSEPYKHALATGVSLGAYIAFNVQRRNPKINQGIYGTAGISVAQAIFTVRVFRRFRKQFEANGFTQASLESAWRDIEVHEDLKLEDGKSLVIVMGGLDRIVRYKTASLMMETWKARGIKARYFSKKFLGHAMTIRWYKNNLGKLLTTYLAH